MCGLAHRAFDCCHVAGRIAAEEVGATVVDPHPYAVGSIKEAFEKYRHIRDTIPAMGYSPQQAPHPLPRHSPLEDTLALRLHVHMTAACNACCLHACHVPACHARATAARQLKDTLCWTYSCKAGPRLMREQDVKAAACARRSRTWRQPLPGCLLTRCWWPRPSTWATSSSSTSPARAPGQDHS